MNKDKSETRPNMEPHPKQNSPWKNMWKPVLLLAVLIAAWIVLEWFFGK